MSSEDGLGIEVKYIANSAKGRGIFARRNFKRGDIIEVCPVLLVPPVDHKSLSQTVLDNYLFDWESEEDSVLLFGYGGLYNHSYTPNAQYIRDFNNKTMVVQAIKNIKEGQEIVFNYNGEPENNAPLDWIKKIE